MPSASGVMPIIYLTTTGAKSGEPRSLPVLSVPDGENLILVGSNWGNPKNPNWIYNLRAHPKAQVRRGNKQQKFRVRELTGDERGIYWQKATTLYPPYTTYQAHAGRTLPMFLLEPES